MISRARISSNSRPIPSDEPRERPKPSKRWSMRPWCDRRAKLQLEGRGRLWISKGRGPSRKFQGKFTHPNKRGNKMTPMEAQARAPKVLLRALLSPIKLSKGTLDFQWATKTRFRIRDIQHWQGVALRIQGQTLFSLQMGDWDISIKAAIIHSMKMWMSTIKSLSPIIIQDIWAGLCHLWKLERARIKSRTELYSKAAKMSGISRSLDRFSKSIIYIHSHPLS